MRQIIQNLQSETEIRDARFQGNRIIVYCVQKSEAISACLQLGKMLYNRSCILCPKNNGRNIFGHQGYFRHASSKRRDDSDRTGTYSIYKPISVERWDIGSSACRNHMHWFVFHAAKGSCDRISGLNHCLHEQFFPLNKRFQTSC